MYDPGPREVVVAHVGKDSSAPRHRSDRRVDESCHPNREENVPGDLETLRNTARDDRSSSHAEGPLEKPAQIAVRNIRRMRDLAVLPVIKETEREELLTAHEATVRNIPVREGPTGDPPPDRAHGAVQQVLLQGEK